MDKNDDGTRTSRTVYDRETETRWGQRNPGAPWWFALLAVPLVLAALAALTGRAGIEDDLTDAATSSLSDADLGEIAVEFDGRDATLSVPDGTDVSEADLDSARTAVEDVDGVRVVDVSDATRSAVSGGEDADGEDAAPAEPTEEASDEPAEEPSDEPAPDCDVTALQGSIDQILGVDKILFRAGRSTIREPAAAQITEVAELLTPCPGTPVTVIGNMNPGAPEGLSQARADSVAGALATEGVAPADITAQGVQVEEQRGEWRLNKYVDIKVG
ncbi:MAG: OmpA family protein [Nocardioides sp.]